MVGDESLVVWNAYKESSRAVSLEAGIGQTLIRADKHYQWKTETRPWISKQNSNLEQK